MTTQHVAESTVIRVIGCVDTHKHTHYAAVVDDHGRFLGHREFPANDRGYQQLLAWLQRHGAVVAIGVESTGSFGATLTRFLTAQAVRVVEVNRPNRLARRMDGKSDRLDAEQIARAVLGQTSTATPKAKSGIVEVIRTLRVTRASAVKARTNTFNTLWGVMIGAPSPLRDELVVLTKKTLVNRCQGLRPESDDLLGLTAHPVRMLIAGVKIALRDLVNSMPRSRRSTSRSTPWSGPLHPSWCSCTAWGLRLPVSSSSPQVTTPNASAARRPSPSSAASHHSPPAVYPLPEALHRPRDLHQPAATNPPRPRPKPTSINGLTNIGASSAVLATEPVRLAWPALRSHLALLARTYPKAR